jgi:predicted transcriptional regulator of viral defense system
VPQSRATWPPLILVRRALADGTLTRWERVARLATDQHGVVALWQLRRLGVSARAASRRCAGGQLHRIHAGVFAVGHRMLGPRGRQMAAVLACGRGALICHLSAADAHGVRPDRRRIVDVAIGSDSGRRRRGIRVHRLLDLTSADIAVRDNLPVTSLPRTLLDVAAVAGDAELRLAIGRAQRARLLDVEAVVELIERSPGRRGVASLREAMAELRPGGGLERSRLERRFRLLCRRHGLPKPVVNGLVHLRDRSLQVDFHWPEARLIVEADSFEFHSDIVAHEEDRRRDQELKRLGWEVLRFTSRQSKLEPGRVARIIVEILAMRTAAGR